MMRTGLTFWRFHARDVSHPNAKKLYWWCLALFAGLGLVFGVLLTQFLFLRAEVERDALARGQQRIDTIAKRVALLLQRVETIADELASDIETKSIEKEAILQRLKDDAKKEPLVFGVGVVFQPHLYSTGQRLYAPFYDQRTDEVVQIEENADYTDLSQFNRFRWHLEPMLKEKPTWVVGLGGPGKVAYLDYGVPFFRKQSDGTRGRLLGVVHIALTLDSLTYLLNKRYVGRLGSGYMIDKAGVILAHPTTEYFNSGRTLQEIARRQQDDRLYDVVEQMRTGDAGVAEARDPETEETVLRFFEPIANTDFAVGMTVFRYELYTHAEELRRKCIGVGLAGLAWGLFLGLLFFQGYHMETVALWSVALLFTMGMLGLLVFVWMQYIGQSPKVVQNQQDEKTALGQRHVIDDIESLRELLSQQEATAKRLGGEMPAIIPTGVYVQAIEFEGANNVKLAGLVWQRYHINDHKDLERGFVFPQVAPDPEAVSIEEPSVEQQGEYEVVTWLFRVVLRLELDYSQYPFDRQQIGLRLQHIEMGKNVLLVPDLDAYQLINTHKKPGLAEELVLPGWDVEGSYFGFVEVSQNANFGIEHSARMDSFPEFQFNILTKREIITPFLSHVFPIVVVAALLYAVLSSTSSDEEKLSVSGFNTFGVLETCGAFFFAIIFVHLDMRTSLDTDTITYLECLHLILYLILLLVALDALMFNAANPPLLIRYEENFLAKVMYWPTLIGLSLFVTLIFFY